MDKLLANITGSVFMTLGLSNLIPEGMWLYLGMVIFGTAVITWNVAREGVHSL